MRKLMLRCPRLFWNVSPRSLSSKVDGSRGGEGRVQGSSTGAFSPHSALTASYLSDTLSIDFSK